MAGWVHDICTEEGYEVLVCNPNQEAWKWKHIKGKTDRDDALKQPLQFEVRFAAPELLRSALLQGLGNLLDHIQPGYGPGPPAAIQQDAL